SKIYFKNGDFIIVCANTAFKVYSGVLAKHSGVISSLLSLPQSESKGKEGHDRIDGCPYTEFYGDNPIDMESFLKAVYDGLYVPNSTIPNMYLGLLSTLVLSTKYFNHHLQQQCIIQIAHDFPADLGSWDKHENDCRIPSGKYIPQYYIPHPAFVIPYLQKSDFLRIYPPAAYYDLSRYTPSQILQG
ncbi:hypothetical protein BDQ17DRAFT_1268059, partial [Cyathus striatus]